MTAAVLVAALAAMTVGPAQTAPQTTLTVARCPYAPPNLPGQAEIALDATLIVRTSKGTGSAVLISPDGFALTAAHVVGGDRDVHVVTHEGLTIAAQVVRVSAERDVALLKVNISGVTSCLRPAEADASLGSDVFILGSPTGEELAFSISKGIVSGYREFGNARFVQLDASVNPGNSGGPAVDNDGAIVGIASWKVSHVSMEGLAFAVPAHEALRALGVSTGAHSSANWHERTDVEAVGEATASPRPTFDSVPRFDPRQVRRKRARKRLFVGGGLLAVSGIVVIAATAAAARGDGAVPRRRWNTIKGFNTLGWVMSIGGAGLVATGLALPKRVHSRVELSVAPARRGLAVQGKF